MGQTKEDKKQEPLVMGIVIFDGVEVLDYCGPFEVFSATRINTTNTTNNLPAPAAPHAPTSSSSSQQQQQSLLGFDVKLIAYSRSRTDDLRRKEGEVQQQPTIINTTGGMKVIPHLSFDNCPPLDILLIPGGIGTRNLPHKQETVDFIRRQISRVKILASVCTGALVLGEAGLLEEDGMHVTTHYNSLDVLQQKYPSINVVRDKHWVVQPLNCSSSCSTTSSSNSSSSSKHAYTLYTSAGISAGIDMALKIVQDVYGEQVARSTARFMEYPFPESQERRIEFS